MRDVIRVIICAALLGGCAAAGVQVTEQQAQAFQVGRSTYADVVAALGEPTSVTLSTRGGRVAVYAYAAISARPQNYIPYIGGLVGGFDERKSAVAFIFDGNGILVETNSTQHSVGSGQNLAAGTPQGGPRPSMPAR